MKTKTNSRNSLQTDTNHFLSKVLIEPKRTLLRSNSSELTRMADMTQCILWVDKQTNKWEKQLTKWKRLSAVIFAFCICLKLNFKKNHTFHYTTQLYNDTKLECFSWSKERKEKGKQGEAVSWMALCQQLVIRSPGKREHQLRKCSLQMGL